MSKKRQYLFEFLIFQLLKRFLINQHVLLREQILINQSILSFFFVWLASVIGDVKTENTKIVKKNQVRYYDFFFSAWEMFKISAIN